MLWQPLCTLGLTFFSGFQKILVELTQSLSSEGVTRTTSMCLSLIYRHYLPLERYLQTLNENIYKNFDNPNLDNHQKNGFCISKLTIFPITLMKLS